MMCGPGERQNANGSDLNELLSLSLSLSLTKVAMPRRERARRNKLIQTLHLVSIHWMMMMIWVIFLLFSPALVYCFCEDSR
jgi:hypothetical protein